MGLVILGMSGLLLTSCGATSERKILGVEDQFARANKLYEKGKYLDSAEEFQKVVYNYPGSNLIDTAQFLMANSYLKDEQFELAAVEFERLIKNYPRSEFSVDSRFLTGYSRYLASPTHYGLDQTDLVTSIRLMNDFIIDYPESRMIPKAEAALLEAHTRLAQKDFRSGMVYVHSRVYTSAIIYFKIVLDDYSNTEYAPLALLEIGKAQSKINELEKSAATFNTFLAQYPDHELVKKAKEELKKVEELLEKKAVVTSTQKKESPADSSSQSPKTEADSATVSKMP